jgi:hypothetical protein
VREWGIEQHVRDARVAMIYEGTNEIQAIDLLLRKVLPDGAQALLHLLADLIDDLNEGPKTQRARQAVDQLAAFTRQQLLPRLQSTDAPADTPHWLADDFLRALALVLMAWAWARIDMADSGDTTRWSTAHKGFWRWVWPEFDMRMATMNATLNPA